MKNNYLKVILNENVYDMWRGQFEKVLATIKKKVSEKTIYAVEKDGICEMKNETYETEELLKDSVKNYEKHGFYVYYKN